MTNAEKALDFVADGMTVGLGSGHAAEAFIRALAASGRQVRGVPTSAASAALASHLGIPLTTLDDVTHLDVTVDGADEVDPHLNLIKGYGHAHVREKVVAAASKKLVILVGPEHVADKVVPVLGTRGKLPVEVLPFALGFCRRQLDALGLPPLPGEPPVSDNGNPILECRTGPIADPAGLELRLRAIPGVVGTGLFVGMASAVLVQSGDTVDVRTGGA
ncbi:MAG TPA: ribose-5-phosphate isomerase RpiA [Gemmataceae bacterium]|jgi:ribose 5-phosphate isomerase A|nr:ribose-5-phosphate isomerase RpiA [Gemmataceae bacterium]